MKTIQNKIIVILGKKGCGKSTLAIQLLAQWEFKPIVIIDPLGEHSIGVPIRIDELDKFKNKSRFIIRLTPFDEHTFSKIIRFCELKTNVLVFIDEASFYQTTSYINPSLDKIIRYGRHYRIDIIMVARRPTELNRISTAMCDILYCFRITEPNDLDYLKRVDARLPDIVSRLKKYEYAKLNFQTDTITLGKTII